MSKVLTLCIPSYNMEKYLNRCIESLINTSIIDNLEVIIVNDGSKDNTLYIANCYKERFPNSIIVIDKPNGHYGSCVNASLKIASGKYFRILDADDWFDSKALTHVVQRLTTLDTDVYFTKCMVQDFRKNKQVPRKYGKIIWNQLLDLNQFDVPECVLSMHSLTYKTQLLREINYKQTEGICYTDTEYVYFPLSQAKTLFAEDIFLYQYYIGRDDQSMSLSSLERNMSHSYPLIERFCSDISYLEGNKNANMIHENFVRVAATQLFIYSLLFFEKNEEREKKNKKLLEKLKSTHPAEFNVILNIKAMGLVPYIKLWYKYPVLFNIVRFFSKRMLIKFI